MTRSRLAPYDNKRDLVIERQFAAPRALVWQALTTPALIQQWFCPRPWQTSACEIELKPGGIFTTTMQSPEGEQFPNTGCILEASENERLVWTSALEGGFRPAPPMPEGGKDCASILFTCIITLEEQEGGTLYRAHVLHPSPQQAKQHEALGFYDGWGTALSQLADVLKTLNVPAA